MGEIERGFDVRHWPVNPHFRQNRPEMGSPVIADLQLRCEDKIFFTTGGTEEHGGNRTGFDVRHWPVNLHFRQRRPEMGHPGSMSMITVLNTFYLIRGVAVSFGASLLARAMRDYEQRTGLV